MSHPCSLVRYAVAALALAACQSRATKPVEPPAPPAAPVLRATKSAPPRSLAISGYVTPEGLLPPDPVFCVGAPSEQPPPGPHKLYLLDAEKKPLATYAFDGRPSTGDAKYYALLVPAIDFAELVIEPQNGLPVHRPISANAPVVKVEPVTEASFSPKGRLRLAWSMSDADREPVLARIETSIDDGKEWKALPGAFSDTSFELDARWLKPTDNARVRVTVTDGVRCASDEVGPFRVPRRPPVVRIRPVAQKQIPKDGELSLRVDVGAENGPVDDKAVIWTSSADGEIGRGQTIVVTGKDRSVGRHELTVTYTDPAGLTNTDRFAVEVVAPKR